MRNANSTLRVFILLMIAAFSPGFLAAQNEVACDFTTGSGWFVNAGAQVSFGVAAGVKNGSLFGHLVYKDRSIELKLKNMTISGYRADGPQTRVVEGTADTNLKWSCFFIG